MNKEDQAKELLQKWVDQQGHDRCWYYPDIFRQLCDLFDVKAGEVQLPLRADFERGCRRYQDEEYKTSS